MAEYEPKAEPQKPGYGGMENWISPSPPPAPLRPGTVTAAPPPVHRGVLPHPTGVPEKE